MSWFVVDVEADGPIPSTYSMVCFGAVRVDHKLDTTFYGETQPISDIHQQEALAISGISRKEHEKFPKPQKTMAEFANWIAANNIKDKPVFISDNLAFDWQWINYYFHEFYGGNPFGFSGRRIANIWCGLNKNPYASWKHLRKTKHTHNPVDDAKGNAEALLFFNKIGFKLPDL